MKPIIIDNFLEEINLIQKNQDIMIQEHIALIG